MYIGLDDKPDLNVIGLFAHRYVHQQPPLQIVAKLNLYLLMIFANRYMVVCQHLYMFVFNQHLYLI